MKRLIPILFLLVSGVAYAEQPSEQWICVADASAGVQYDKKANGWRGDHVSNNTNNWIISAELKEGGFSISNWLLPNNENQESTESNVPEPQWVYGLKQVGEEKNRMYCSFSKQSGEFQCNHPEVVVEADSRWSIKTIGDNFRFNKETLLYVRIYFVGFLEGENCAIAHAQ